MAEARKRIVPVHKIGLSPGRNHAVVESEYKAVDRFGHRTPLRSVAATSQRRAAMLPVE